MKSLKISIYITHAYVRVHVHTHPHTQKTSSATNIKNLLVSVNNK